MNSNGGFFVDGMEVLELPEPPRPRRRRPVLYGLDTLEVDAHVVVPYGDEERATVHSRVRNYAMKMAERVDYDFKVDRVPQGIRVTRLN